MALTFYYGSGSPFAWRVWLALEHKKIPYEMKTISFSSGDLTQPEFLAINPRHKVPAIVDEGFALYESTAIVEYLEEKYSSGDRLFPEDTKQRALARRLVQEADLYLNSSMRLLIEQIFFAPEEKWDAAKIERGAQAFSEELAMWEKAGIGRFMVGSSLSAADFAVYPVVALALRLEKKKRDLGIRQMIGPKVATWMENMTQQPIIRTTWPPHWK
ncbi:MAG: glutathione S-transferase family protein [Betaproteobacteria bacterium]|nr:glutathione S-transferase family protein [Betaproteobacteria bacterium]